MKKTTRKSGEGKMRSEYDLKGGERGKHYRAIREGYAGTTRQSGGNGEQMNIRQITEWLKAGEGVHVEFKEKYNSRVIESLAAFANTSGGQVLIGVDARGQVVGLADAGRAVESVISACREAVNPPLAPQVETFKLPEGVLVVASVQATGRMHAKSGAVFIRHGRQTRRATSEEIRILTLHETPEVFETLPATGANWTDFNLPRLRDHLSSSAPRASAAEAGLTELAVTARLAVVQAGQTLPTNAGLVLFGREPQRYNSSWGITALRIRGTTLDRNLVIDRRELTGTADALVEAGQQFVADHMQVAYQFKANHVKRQDLPQYSLDAVREAITNAVAHRDYQPAETIQVRMFDDRLEVQNPGGLLPGLTLDAVLRGGVARRRNEVISEFLKQWGYVEKAGFGIVFIRQRMRELGAGEPRFEAPPTHFIVTLPAREPSA
jgi:ATP-dependent DNA helicase RecG